jgi:hypothetical protein
VGGCDRGPDAVIEQRITVLHRHGPDATRSARLTEPRIPDAFRSSAERVYVIWPAA